MDQRPIHLILSKELEKIRKRNPSYSMRAFATKLGINSGALSSIISGKRKVSLKMAKKLSLALGLEGKELKKFLSPFTGEVVESDIQTIAMENAHQKVLLEWQHAGILCMVDMANFKNDPGWIAKKLGLETQIVKEAINRMIEMEILELNTRTGRLSKKSEGLLARGPRDNQLLLKSVQNDLFRAVDATSKYSGSLRHSSALTLAINPKKIMEAREMIMEFVNKLADFLETGKKTEVYKFVVSLYPLTIPEVNQD